ncbi:hypothetical protein ACFQ3J_14945 [Paenibacillus provencensis]|uniref:Uncharacterized protein n=1 Tax=Paenibacillus provencensis TaxID=441151 RepID=A0ABW3PPU5_9BACL|nr:hypothetical protein [Paenibacillus sp. MER 78]
MSNDYSGTFLSLDILEHTKQVKVHIHLYREDLYSNYTGKGWD